MQSMTVEFQEFCGFETLSESEDRGKVRNSIIVIPNQIFLLY